MLSPAPSPEPAFRDRRRSRLWWEIGIVLALSYWILLHVFLAIGGAGVLPPFLAGWSANIIVAGAAAYMFLSTKT